MFELFTTFESFSAYIVLLTVLAVLAILFESKLVEIEDRIRDYFAELFNHNSCSRSKKSKQSIAKKTKTTVSDSKNKGSHFAA